MAKERWCIYIDMEGFSALYDKEDQILSSFCEMMRAIYRIGTRAYPAEGDRLFVHQTGDGFAVESDFHESSPVRAISIATVILRHVASTGRFARAAIAEGELADITGCYPKEVTDGQTTHRTVDLGAGLMTLFPVMGMGLIRAFGVSKSNPPGPLLLLDSAFLSRLPDDVPTLMTGANDGAPLSVDWIHIQLPLADWIQSQAQLPPIASHEIETKLIAYCKKFHLPKWATSVRQFLQITC
jgi:hypothetical protein